jgi:hypothetical protein
MVGSARPPVRSGRFHLPVSGLDKEIASMAVETPPSDSNFKYSGKCDSSDYAHKPIYRQGCVVSILRSIESAIAL